MDDSMQHSGWDASNNAKPIDTQSFDPDMEFWNSILSGSQPPTNASIDSIVAAPQDFQNIATSNQELSPNLGNEATSPDFYTSKYGVPIEDENRDIKKEARELQDMFHDLQKEMVSLKEQVGMVHKELCTIRSNHSRLLKWTIDMGEVMDRLVKWLGEQTGMEAVDQQGFHTEDLAPWMNPDFED